MARRWRSWAFESAALDLALRRPGSGCPRRSAAQPAPVRFVNSLGLGDPPAFAHDRPPPRALPGPALQARRPGVVVARRSPPRSPATGAVDVIDFKGRYGLPVEDEFALLAMYEAVLDRFDGVILEDPHDRPDVAALHRAARGARLVRRADRDRRRHRGGRRSAPGSSTSSRRGSAACARCSTSTRTARRNGVRMYGGGMGELGIARGQIELLASLFHPDGPNDVAPSAYNLPDLPAGLPESPLMPPARITGFRWA